MDGVPSLHAFQVGLHVVFEDRNLVDHLKESYGEASSLKLPSKQVKLFQTKTSMDKRRDDLTVLLRDILASPQLLKDESTQAFLKQNYVSMESTKWSVS